MFRFLKSTKKEYPEFKKLNESEIKDKFFQRIAKWYWLNKELIVVMDPKSQRLITMDPWPQLVFLDADGQKTIKDFILITAKKYKKIPDELDEVILFQINQLIKEGIIELSDTKIQLDKEFSSPIKQ